MVHIPGTLARHLLLRSLRSMAWVLAGCQAAAVFLAVLVLAVRLPTVNPMRVLAALPDVLIVTFPWTVLMAVVLGLTLTVVQAHERRELLWVALAGRRALAPWMPSVFVFLLLSPALWWWTGWAAPSAATRLERRLAATAEDPTQMAQWLQETSVLPRFGAIRFRADDGIVRDMASLRDQGRARILADAVRFSVEDRWLDVTLDGARIVERTDQKLRLNLAAQSLTIRLDRRSLTPRSRENLSDAQGLTMTDLAGLAELRLAWLTRGRLPDPSAAAVMAAAPALMMAQALAAILPALAVLSVVAWIAGPLPRRGAWLVPLAILTVAVPCQMVIGRAPGPWTWWLGTGPALGCLLLIAVAPAWRQGRSA